MGIGFEHDTEKHWLEADLIERGAFLNEDLFLNDYEIDEFLDSTIGRWDSEMAY